MSLDPWVATSVAELLRDATERRPVKTVDAKSGARFEKLIIKGRPCFLKVLSTESDWIMRCTGNTSYWEFQVWSAGRYHAAPGVIDHAMIGMALESTDGEPRLAMLMDDRSADLVPPGDQPIAAGPARTVHRAPGDHACRGPGLAR